MATGSALNSALQQSRPNMAAPVQSTKQLNSVLEAMMPQIAKALPVHFKNNAEKYTRQLITLHSVNPDLQNCTLGSQLQGLMNAAQLGLDLAPQLGQCYIIPRRNGKTGGWDATFQLGYRGIIALAMRSGAIARIYADVVYEKDEFKYSKGLHGYLEHTPTDDPNRGQITHVYALAEFTNGGYAFDVWSKAKVDAHRNRFSKARYSPWNSDWEAMAKKTLILALKAYLPISTEVMTAIENDVSEARKMEEVTLEPVNFNVPATEAPEAEENPAVEAEEIKEEA